MMKNINALQYLEYTKQRCKDDFTFFVRYFFKHLKGRKFLFSDHHYVICDALMDVFFGRTTYLIINVAPRYSKSELIVKMFSAWCYAKNPACEFIHLSYSDSLALDNSDTIKQILKSFEFQQLWPQVAIRQNKDSKKSWETTLGGNYYATAAGGSVTGFGAGKVDDFENGNGFGGCFPYDELVMTNEGYIKIGDIVESNLNVKVMSKCIESHVFEFKEIDRYWHNPPNDIIEISLSNGDSFRCTPDHEIFTKNGKVKAKDLSFKDRLIFATGIISNISSIFINCIGHCEKTYCLEVRDNNNFTVSKSQILVSNCILVDDPLKPDDAFSEPKRKSVNARWDGTIKSRFNSSKTPCIVVAQRLHDDDFCSMLEDDEEYDFKVLSMPAIINEGTDNEKALWENKHNLAQLHKMKKKSPYMFSGQMQQRPSPLGGGLIRGEWFGRYKILPKLKYRAMYADTAQKKKEANDYQVAICFGLGEDDYLYIIDVLRDKFEAYELEKRFPDFWQKHLNADKSKLRYFGIEDKSSGTELIQKIKNIIKPAIPVKAIPRNIDKLTRVMDIQGYIQSGYVKIPENAGWVHDFVAECEAFTANDSHKHDDQVDPLCDAISDMLHNVGSMIHIG